MEHLSIPFFPLPQGVKEFPADLAKESEFRLSQNPWKTGTGKEEVRLRAAHTGSHLALQFLVKEPLTLARYLKDGDPVYKDSCVEFFVETPSAGGYLNFEFNALGTCLAQMGPSRNSRQILDTSSMKKIQRFPSLTSALETPRFIEEWRLTVILPLGILWNTPLDDLKLRGNFYKCGDDLPAPHYLCWAPLTSPRPDFHRPGDFGLLDFRPAALPA